MADGQLEAWVSALVWVLGIIAATLFVDTLARALHLVGIHKILGRTVAAIASFQTYREIGFLQGVGICHRAIEDNLWSSFLVCIVVGCPQTIVGCSQSLALLFGRINQFPGCQGCLMPKLCIIVLIEERTGMIKGSTGLQGKNGKLVGTTGLYLATYRHIAQIGIIYHDAILDAVAGILDEIKHLVGRTHRQTVQIICRNVVAIERCSIILANQAEVVISTQEAGLPAHVLILEHLLRIVVIILIVGKLLVGKLIQEEVAVGDALQTAGPESGMSIGRTQSTIIEVFDAIAAVGILTLISGRSHQGIAVIPAVVVIHLIIGGGEEALHTTELLSHVITVIDIILVVVHLL